ncbi:MAG: imidazole glycerol phosphate synthase subunit HisF, partial [Bacillota bacterium]|nr:imidazole glycerol phosphate synthase subunit HisF [Bacillota bacterium]
RRIIPCLDVDQGRVVKGVNFGNLRSVGDPVELAQAYEAQGADEIVILDISATIEGRGTTLELVRKVAQNLSIPLTVGGGVRTCDDARSLLRAGADKVAVNTAFYRTPSLITELAQEFGSQCVVAAVDVIRQGNAWVVVVSAGKEVTGLDAITWMQELEARGAGEVLLTSIDCDGVTGGYDLELLTATAQALSIPVIASGGAGTVEDMAQAFAARADACLAASMFHYGTHTVSSVKEQLRAQGVATR